MVAPASASASAARAHARPIPRLLGGALAALLWLQALPAAATGLAPPPSSTGGQPAPRLTAEVVGYLPYWEMTADTFAQVDLTKLTSIALFSVGWDSAGRLRTAAPGYRAIVRSDTASFVDRAQAAGVRVLVSFTSFGVSKNAAFFSNPAAQATFVQQAAAFVAAHDLDGADIDVELIQGAYFDAYADTAAALRSELRDADDQATVTVATNGNTSGARMAAKALDAGVDRAFLMGYSYRTAGSSPGSIDPLARVSGDTGLSLTASLGLYAQEGVPLDRVILGLPLYGRSWATVDGRRGSPRRPGISGSGAFFRLRELASMRATGRIVALDTVPVELSARLVRVVRGVYWQSFYDSPATLRAKLRLVFSRQLAGAGFWALGYSNGRRDYWTAVGDVFGPPAITFLRVSPSPTNTRAVSVRLRWREGAGTATHVRFAHGDRVFGPWRPIGTTHALTLPTGPAVVRRMIRVQLRDDGGMTSVVKVTYVLVDRARPTMAGLSVGWSTSIRAWVIRYIGRDVGSGMAGYRIVLKRDGVYTTLALRRTTSPYILRIPHRARFLISVRAIDKAGNMSTAAYAGR